MARYCIGPGGVLQLALDGILELPCDGEPVEPVTVQIPSLEPDARSARLVVAALTAAGISVGRVSVQLETASAGQRGKCLHVIYSAPTRDIMHECMLMSNNLHAQCLLRLLSRPKGSSSLDQAERRQSQRREVWEEQGPLVAVMEAATARVSEVVANLGVGSSQYPTLDAPRKETNCH